jgi:hypothetical protein
MFRIGEVVEAALSIHSPSKPLPTPDMSHIDPAVIARGVTDVRMPASHMYGGSRRMSAPYLPKSIQEQFPEETSLRFPGTYGQIGARVGKALDGFGLVYMPDIFRAERAAQNEIDKLRAEIDDKVREAFKQGAESISAPLGEGAL